MLNLDKQTIYLRSMGKALKVLAIAESDAEANQYCERHDNAAVVACIDRLVFIADRYDHGTPIPREY